MQRHDRLAAVPDRAARRVRLALGRIVDHAVCMCDAPSRALAATFGPVASHTSHIPIMLSITDGSTMGLFECIFVFDFINTLGVVHVPHLRNYGAGGAAAARRRAGSPAGAGPPSWAAALTHVTSEKSRRPVP